MTSWVPSHVDLTIHQARDLLLKTKNSSSLVYVCVVAEGDKYCTSLLPRSSAPLWQHTTRIPLMSLDTTLLCSVRQKTSIKDKFLGLITIPLSGFTVSSKPVTHWYKLGAKVGKKSNKLRGELLLSIKFLSNWVAEETEALDFVNGFYSDKLKSKKIGSVKSASPLALKKKNMIKRTKSLDIRTQSRDMTSDSTVRESEGEGERGGKTKREKSGRFRLSIKKKTRSPVLEACDDEFTSLSVPSKPTQPISGLSSSSDHNSPQSEGDIFHGQVEHLSRSLDPKYLPNGRLRSNTVEGVGGREGEVSGSVRGGGEEGGTEAGSPVKDGGQTPTEKMSPALRYHNFRRRKRPWSMHSIPPSPQFHTTDTSPNSKPELDTQSPEKANSSEVVTYRAKSSGGLVRGASSRRGGGAGRSSSVDTESRNHQQRATDTDPDSSLESLGGSNRSTPTHSPLLGSAKSLRSSDRTANRSKSSGLGNITHSSTLPASMRQRSQSMSSDSVTRYSRGGTKSTLPSTLAAERGEQRADSSPRQVSSHMKSMGLGPRVPLGTSLTDSPRRGSATNRTPHIVSGDLTPKSSTSFSVHGGSGRTISPIQLESTLVEEDEEGGKEEGKMEGEGGSGRGRTVPDGSPSRQQQQQVVKSRVLIETESSAFQVDARELQIVLEATPRQGKSVVATPPTKESQSVSLPSSPLSSPARQRKLLPIVPGEDSPSGNVRKGILPITTQDSRKPAELLQTLTPVSQQGDGRAQSTSPIAASQRGDPCPIERSVSTMALAGGRVEMSRGVDGLTTLPRSSNTTPIRHTVSFKEKPTQDYEAIPALPPCLRHSPTLPRHADLTRRHSEADRPISALVAQNGTRAVHNFPAISRADPGLHNIRTFDPRLFNLPPLPQRVKPKVSITNASFDETDSPSTSSVKQTPPSPPRPSTAHARSVTPETPRSPLTPTASSSPQKMVQSYPGTPSPPPGQERGGRRGGGGLQGAMSRYQENRRKNKPSHMSGRGSGKVSPALSSEGGVTAGESPKLLRKAATHLGHTPRSPERGWRNPFSNLRRTQSHKNTLGQGQYPHIDAVSLSRLQGSTHSSIDSVDRSSTGSSPQYELSAAPNSNSGRLESSGDTPTRPSSDTQCRTYMGIDLAAKNSNSNNEQCGLQVVATPTSFTSDTDSIRTFGSERTLVEGGGCATGGDGSGSATFSLRQELLNLPPTRHKQTCSSVDSEGLGSLASEEIEEAGPHEWAQWSKDELVKELIHTKNKLHSTEEELKAVRGYLDNLLLRIMETNPGILSVGNLDL